MTHLGSHEWPVENFSQPVCNPPHREGVDNLKSKILNVRTVPWLPVLTANGAETLGLEEALLRAHEIERITIRDPLARHATLHFLVSVAALIARRSGIDSDNAGAVAAAGFDESDVLAVLNGVDERLWLVHPETPFLQERRYLDIVGGEAAAKRGAKIAAELLPHVPGLASKAWWNQAGGEFQRATLTPAEAILALLTVWLHAPGGKASVGKLGRSAAIGSSVSVRTYLWWKGQSLAETILLNLDESWVRGDALPGWATTISKLTGLEPITECTQPGSSVLLFLSDTSIGEIVFDRALYGGAIREGFDGHSNPTQAAKDIRKEAMVQARLKNPRVAKRIYMQAAGGVKKLDPVNGPKPEFASMQNLTAWYGGGPVQPRLAPGLLSSTTQRISVLVTEGSMNTYYQMASAMWFDVGGEYAQLTDEQYGNLTTLISEVPSDIKHKLDLAAKSVFPPPVPVLGKAVSPAKTLMWYRLSEIALSDFYALSNEALEQSVSSVLSGEPYIEHNRYRWNDMAKQAFLVAVKPYQNVNTLPAIAVGLSRLAYAGFKPEGTK